MGTETNAIEKLNNISKWASWQDVHFLYKLNCISVIEKIYDYCLENGIEFADSFDSDTEVGTEKHQEAIEKIAGVKLY